jgi:hypothetical protein
MGMFSDWLKKDEPKGLEGARRRILEGMEDLTNTQRQNVKDAIDKKIGLGKTPQGKERKRNIEVPGQELAQAVDKVSGATQRATYNPDEDKTPSQPLKIDPDSNLQTPQVDDRIESLKNESMMNNPGEGRVAGHDLGSSKRTAADLNKVIEERESLRKKYEDDMKNIDTQEGIINEEASSRRKMIDQLIMNIGDGSSSEQLRDRFIAIAARAATYPKKVRAGKGARSITSDDREALIQESNLKRLADGYGDGSWEQMKKFAGSMRILQNAMPDDEWDRVAEKWFDSQANNIKSVFEGAGSLGAKDGGATMHYGGVNPDGTKIGGTANNRVRTLALAKVFLQQGGLDGYTGLPLRFEHMEPDHIRGFSQLVDGQKPGREDRMMADHPDNWVWTSTGVNNIKSNDALPQFIEKLQGMDQEKIDGMMSSDTLQLQDEGQRYLTDDTTDFARSHVLQFSDENGTVNILNDTLTQSMIDERQGQQDGMIKSLQEMGAKVDQSRLMTDMFAAGGQVPKQFRLNLPSQNKEAIRERSQTKLGDNAMREMYRAMLGKPPEQQAKIARAWLQSWDESIQEIKDQFKLSDEGQDLTNDQVVTADDGVMKGGPTLRKLFALKLKELLGDEADDIVNTINVREMFDFDQ